MKTMDAKLAFAMPGTMMDVDLTIGMIFEHILRNNAEREVVSRNDDGSIFRYTYGDFGKRVAQLAHALVELGVKPGDRVDDRCGLAHDEYPAFSRTSRLGFRACGGHPRIRRHLRCAGRRESDGDATRFLDSVRDDGREEHRTPRRV